MLEIFLFYLYIRWINGFIRRLSSKIYNLPVFSLSMRLAVIDYEGYINEVFKGFSDIELSCSKSFEEFEMVYGDLSKFDGAMLHPGRFRQREALEYMKRYPGMKFCILSLNPGDYHFDGEIAIIPAYDIARIIKYFGVFEQK